LLVAIDRVALMCNHFVALRRRACDERIRERCIQHVNMRTTSRSGARLAVPTIFAAW
jgi:hypothetical protein